MKDYNSIKHTLLVFNRKETLVDTIIEQDKKIDELKEKLSIYESDTDTVVMTKDKWEETKQEVERLKSLWETDRQSWNEQMAELTEENERLNNIIKEQGLEDKPNYYVNGLEGCLKEYQEEVKRLNNIINELEKELKWQRKVSLTLNEGFAVSRIDILTNKLQELKGSDKE